MTVDGLRKSTAGNFGFWVSQYMYIHMHAKQPTGIKAVVIGIMDAFASFVNAMTEIFLKIPVLKQSTQLIISVIGRIFAVDDDAAKAIFNKIIMAIIIIVISYFTAGAFSAAIGTTGATTASVGLSTGLMAGMQTAITISSNALTLYNTATQAAAVEVSEELDEQQRREAFMKARNQNATNPGATAFGNTMGTLEEHEAKNKLMYDIMFNPFNLHPQAIPAEELPSGIIK